MPTPVRQNPRACQDRLDALRGRRVKRPYNNSMQALFQNEAEIDAKSERSFGKLGQAWEATCPAAILPSTVLLRYQRSTLTVGVRDSATLYLLRRAISPQFRDAIARLAHVPLQKIDLRINDTPSTSDSRV